MVGRERMRLTDAAIDRLRPGGKEYTVWDSRVAGLGVRVRPAGGKSYVLLHDVGRGSKRVTLGPVSTMGIAEARRDGLARLTTRETPGDVVPGGPAPPLLRDFVEGEWKKIHFDRYNPSTRKSVRSLLGTRILPAFGRKPLDRVTPARIERWFDEFSRSAPGNANHALALLRQIMNLAVARGYIDANPARGVRPNPRPAITRFLSREEIDRLQRALDGQDRRGGREQADIIRLLLLTGCRKGEILHLRWSEVQEGALMLAGGKTGPRAVPLNSQARRVLDRQPRGNSPYVFPSPRDPTRPRSDDLPLWYRVRREAEIENVRLHDLRHTFASQAVMNGIPVPVVSRMLGHSNVGMTMRYAHLGDREIEAAAERVGEAIAELMGLPSIRTV